MARWWKEPYTEAKAIAAALKKAVLVSMEHPLR